jgi:error-prone DNA polymerase
VVYTELHARSAFSFLRGASLPEAMVERAAALGQPAVAICDHMGFAGSARAHQAAVDSGIRALVGTTLDLSAIARRATAEVPSIKGQGPKPAHIPVLCATRSGYSSLCQFLSRQLAHSRGGRLQSADPKPPAQRAALPLWNLALGTWPFEPGSLVALTGDRDGPLCQPLLRHDPGAALAAARSLVETFGRENVYVQLVRHGLRDEPRLHRQLVDLARHLRLPLLATNSPLHATRADRPLADAFTCLRHHTTLDAAGSLLTPNGARHLASAATMRRRFADIPEALDNTRRLAERLEFTLACLGYRFPSSRDPDGRLLPPDEERRLLRELTFRNAPSRFPRLTKNVRRQLDHELELIGRLGFSGYFLIVHDLVLFARSRGILCQGRGSAANSAVCFALGITAVDPVNGGLLFERFLSENRRTWPDIDLDLPSGDQREAVIRYVFEKYAPHGAAMTANVITYRSRSAFREMSKVLGFPPSVADRFSSMGSTRFQRVDSGILPESPASPRREAPHSPQSLIPDIHPRGQGPPSNKPASPHPTPAPPPSSISISPSSSSPAISASTPAA